MKRSYAIAKTINAVVCIAIVVAIMICAYNSWSRYGEYTVTSFIFSLMVHGGMGVMLYIWINGVLKEIFKNKNK